jgi:cytochrome c peroxidase
VGTAERHAPSLWNVAYQRWFFWDGRVDSLWAQFVVPLEHPRAMGFARTKLVDLIRRDGRLRDAYERVFGPLPDWPGQATPRTTPEDRRAVDAVVANVGKAVAAYQRKLVSRRAPFDVFVEGLRTNDPRKLGALAASAQRGLKRFVTTAECRLCHVGPNFSDGEFHNLGLPLPGGGEPNDPGRFRGAALVRDHEFNALSRHSDGPDSPAARRLQRLAPANESWGAFKTPTLRNVARTAPYMHTGQFASLREVLRFYSTLEGQVRANHHQEQILMPLNLSDREIDDIIAFLESLTDERIDPALLKPLPR